MANKSHHLPGVSTLVNTSLNIFTQKLKQLVIWTIISIGVYFLAVIILAIALLIAGVQVLPLFKSGIMNPQALNSAGVAVGIISVVFILIFGIAGIITETGFILLIASEFKKGYKSLLRTSFTYIIPLFIVGILSTIILAGSAFVFIIPALIFAFLMSFVAYEVVIHDVRGLQAIKNSIRIVLDNFWGILGRILLLWVVSFLVTYGFLAFVRTQHGLGYFTIAYYAFRILFGWFSTVYSIVLYKEARAAADLKKPAPMIVLWVFTVIGWVIIAALVYSIGRFVAQGGAQQIMQQLFERSNPYSHTAMNSAQNQLQKSQSLLNQIRTVSTTEQEPQRTQKIQKLNDENIKGLKQALLNDSNNQQLLQVLCVSYQLPNTVGTTADKSLACSRVSLPTTVPSQ